MFSKIKLCYRFTAIIILLILILPTAIACGGSDILTVPSSQTPTQVDTSQDQAYALATEADTTVVGMGAESSEPFATLNTPVNNSCNSRNLRVKYKYRCSKPNNSPNYAKVYSLTLDGLVFGDVGSSIYKPYDFFFSCTGWTKVDDYTWTHHEGDSDVAGWQLQIPDAVVWNQSRNIYIKASCPGQRSKTFVCRCHCP